MSFSTGQPRVAIIGGGIGGLATAIALRRKGFDNFVIYERAGDIGGTWRDNTYPGAGSDVGGHWYCLSTDLNPNWSTYFVDSAEIKQYWDGLVLKYALQPRVVLNTSVTLAEWDEEMQLYKLTLTDTKKGGTRHEEAEVVVSAIGGLVSPYIPKELKWEGIFKGDVWHSARWRHDVSLKGKRVAVIGNGCSAAQLVPQITNDPTVKVVQFCKTPNWFLPRGNFAYSSFVKWTFAHVPLAMKAYRLSLAAYHEFLSLAFQKSWKSVMGILRKMATDHMVKTAPKSLLGHLMPDYTPGCKRIIFDPDYLVSLHKPNLTTNWDGAEKILPNGIQTKKGEIIPCDIIVFATGFDVYAMDLDVKGIGRCNLRDEFLSKDGPSAYLGTAFTGYPNFYMLMGPNTVTGHASVIYSEEIQIDYILRLIDPILHHNVRSFDVTRTATVRYNQDIQKRMENTVFVDCHSWYRADGHQGRNVAIFPGPIMLLWWWCLKPRWSDYAAVGDQEWKHKANRRKFFRTSVLLSLLGTAGYMYYYPSSALWDIWGTVTTQGVGMADLVVQRVKEVASKYVIL